MMNLTRVAQEQRRLAILRTLTELEFHLNEDVLIQALDEMSISGATKDRVRADMEFLEQHALIRLERLPKAQGELWVAHLLTAGKEVANGRPHTGVAQRQPDC